MKNWLIKKLGGFTENEFKFQLERNKKLLDQLKLTKVSFYKDGSTLYIDSIVIDDKEKYGVPIKSIVNETVFNGFLMRDGSVGLTPPTF